MIDSKCPMYDCEGGYELVALDVRFAIFVCQKCGRIRVYRHVTGEQKTMKLEDIIRELEEIMSIADQVEFMWYYDELYEKGVELRLRQLIAKLKGAEPEQ